MTHWKHLRDHFVRTKRIRDSTPQSDIKECEWQWWSQMQWMVPYIGRRIYQKKMSKPTSTGPNGDRYFSNHPRCMLLVPIFKHEWRISDKSFGSASVSRYKLVILLQSGNMISFTQIPGLCLLETGHIYNHSLVLEELCHGYG